MAVSSEDDVRQAVVMVVRTLAFVIVWRVVGLVGRGSVPDAKDIEIGVPRARLEDAM
jgi:hypothetical protein